ncbi:MAG: lipocalin-like domain-containing protein [Prevotella sp.]|nr:lipocalin-like domain-containing protein [Prevotella sp.]
MRTNKIYIALTALVLCISGMLTGCTLETSGNGKLDGYWHMTAVDTIATGGTCDLSQKRLFWGVQAKLINLSDRDDLSYNFFMRFEYAKTTLRLFEPYQNDRIEGDPVLEDATKLEPFGIEGMEQSFKIEELKGKKMTLASENLRLHFEKM